MDKIKQNIALTVGFAIPVIMMLVIAGVIYFPRWFNEVEPPQHDFIYAAGDGVIYPAYDRIYAYPTKGVWPKYTYRIVGGKLTRQESGPVPPEYGQMPIVEDEPKFFAYHVATHTSVPLTFEEAALYTLDQSAKSPDGYEVVRGNGSNGNFSPFFYDGNNDYDKEFIRKDYYAEELNLNLPSDWYGEFFVAWVIKSS
jgi:hypothetical protein